MSGRGEDRPRPNWSNLLRAAALTACGVLIAALLSGLWRSALVTPAGRAWLAAYLITALVSPRVALLILAALVPIVGMASLFAGIALPPASTAEALVLCLLFGRAVRGTFAPAATLTRADVAAVSMACIAATSAIAFAPVFYARMGDSGIGAAIAEFLRYYFLRTGDVRPVHDAALFAESGALFVVARRSSADPAFRLSLLRMLLVGATAAATFNILRLVTSAARAESFGAAFLLGLQSIRINVHHGDLNAAGSFFALFLCVALGFARGRHAWWAWLSAVVLALGLWMAGSRTAMAAIGVAALGLSLWTAVRGRAATRRLALAGAVLTLAAAATVIVMWPRGGANMAMGPAFQYRLQLWSAASRMLAEHPVTGVGIGQFPPLSTRYRPPGIDGAPQAAENTHNNLLQIGAELGLPGLIAFVLWVAFAVAPAVRRMRAGEAGRLEAALLTGIVTFVLTCLPGHPLLLPTVAFPFWLAVAAVDPATTAVARSSRPVWIGAAAVIALLATIPARTSTAFREANLEHVGRNLSSWLDGADGVKYRRAENCSGLYVPSHAVILTLPVRLDDGVSGPLRVALAVDDRQVNAFVIDRAGWMPLRVRLPEVSAPGGFRFVALRVHGAGDESCGAIRLAVGKATTLDRQGNLIQ